MYKEIKKKLNKSGASIAIALMLFLCCTVVSAIIISAASVLSGRMSELKSQEQTYLITSSIVDMILRDMEGVEFTLTASGGTYQVEKRKSGGIVINEDTMADFIAKAVVDYINTNKYATEPTATTTDIEFRGTTPMLSSDSLSSEQSFTIPATITVEQNRVQVQFKGMISDGLYASEQAYNITIAAKVSFSDIVEGKHRVWFTETSLVQNPL